jgi:hypothetical protein
MKTTSAKATQMVADEQATQSVAAGPTPEEQLEPERQGKIAEHAYQLALARGFAPGHELDDWLVAEKALEEGAVAQAA